MHTLRPLRPHSQPHLPVRSSMLKNALAAGSKSNWAVVAALGHSMWTKTRREGGGGGGGEEGRRGGRESRHTQQHELD